MPIQTILNPGACPVYAYTDEIESSARQQLENLARLPIIHHHLAAMPDVHAGRGSTIGSVIPTLGAVIPAAVGVDIGCGMSAVQLSLNARQMPDNLARVRAAIEARVPVGMAGHEDGQWCEEGLRRVAPGLAPILARYPQIAARWQSQLGSLGGGNHFIELCVDEADSVWVMLHSGSRGIGNRIGSYFIEQAREEMLRLDRQLPDRDLAYLSEGSVLFDDYVQAVGWAQDYALENRRQLLRLTLAALRTRLPSFRLTAEAIECHHNYVRRETHYGEAVWLTRKGAISARQGEFGIIPGSMGSHSYIVRGKGDPASFCSCAHGAGRRMSRTQARKRFSREDLRAQTQGVECRKDAQVIDEIPAAYKDLDRVMAQQASLVEVVHRLRQLVCVKG